MSQHELSSKPHHQHLILFVQLTACTFHLRPWLFYFSHKLPCFVRLFVIFWYVHKQHILINSEISVLFPSAYHLFFLLYHSNSFSTHSLIQVFLEAISSIIIYSQMCMITFCRAQLRAVETAWINLELTYQNWLTKMNINYHTVSPYYSWA